jgi:glycosyltransferase involved in cell wall biosynthesis
LATYYPLVPREYPRRLSLVLPVYNEVEVLPLVIDRLKALLPTLSCETEVIFVNDGSSDRSLDILIAQAEADPRFKVVALARNFGHQIAATAGLDSARGDAVVLMDADLQDPPELISQMIARYCEGYDIVYARRTKREGETMFKRFSAWAFYRLMQLLVDRHLPVDVGDYRLMSRTSLDTLCGMGERHRFLRGMASWIGFATTFVEFVRPPRAAGETKYPFRRMFTLAWNAAVSFSPLPLRLTFLLGGLFTMVGCVYGAYAVFRLAMGLYVVPGWTSSIVILCLTSGATMLCLGVFGEYLARLYDEVKARPLYTVYRTINVSPPKDL